MHNIAVTTSLFLSGGGGGKESMMGKEGRKKSQDSLPVKGQVRGQGGGRRGVLL